MMNRSFQPETRNPKPDTMNKTPPPTATPDAETGAAVTAEVVRRMLDRIRDARVAVVGDYCLDVYWFVDASRSEKSLETGLPTRPVRAQRCSLGGAGNVVANIVAMGCRQVHAIGVVGDDPWGHELRRLLDELSVDTAGMLVQRDDWATLAYNKPVIENAESNRFDFGNFNVLSSATAEALIERCRACLPEIDVLVINEQVKEGIHSEAFREALAALMREHPHVTFVADSRHYCETYRDAILKVNEREALRLCGSPRLEEDLVLREETLAATEGLYERLGRDIVVSRGDRGLVVRDAGGVHEIPGIQVLGRVDTVGAGDTVLAGLSLGLAVGERAVTAAGLGNFAAGVTIQKLNQTGTATPAEIAAMAEHGDFVFRPELADDPRRARMLPGTAFEIVTQIPDAFRARVAIFDHDGTLSTLREGWELLMEPMMVRAILGERYDDADESLFHRVSRRVRDYIDKSTGVQTLVQMSGLIDLIREFGLVPEDAILDAHGYKAVYNEALVAMVRERVARLERGELVREDFAIKNAVPLLERLSAAGVRLYLASGTDVEDVRAEARAMGYAALFDGGIYGSVGDVTRDAKRIVLDQVLDEIGPGAVRGLVTFGDGPVEMRETKRRGGLAVGVATDEKRRFELNLAKRARLIRAGADLVVPDFAQHDRLLLLLGIESGTQELRKGGEESPFLSS